MNQIKNFMIHKGNTILREVVYIQLKHLLGEKSFVNDFGFIEIG
jgi:hypothetical protein